MHLLLRNYISVSSRLYCTLANFIVLITCACVLRCFSCIQLCAMLWTVARQAPLKMGVSRQEYWSGLPCLSPEDLPNPGSKPEFLLSLALAGGFFTTSTICNCLFLTISLGERQLSFLISPLIFFFFLTEEILIYPQFGLSQGQAETTNH